MTKDQAFGLLKKIDDWYFYSYQNIYGYADGFFIAIIKLGSDSIRLYIESDADDYTGICLHSVEYPNTSGEYQALNRIMKLRYATVYCVKEYREGSISFARKEKILNFRHGGRPLKKSSFCTGHTENSNVESIAIAVFAVAMTIILIIIHATQ